MTKAEALQQPDESVEDDDDTVYQPFSKVLPAMLAVGLAYFVVSLVIISPPRQRVTVDASHRTAPSSAQPFNNHSAVQQLRRHRMVRSRIPVTVLPPATRAREGLPVLLGQMGHDSQHPRL
jgi:hypothetical protein